MPVRVSTLEYLSFPSKAAFCFLWSGLLSKRFVSAKWMLSIFLCDLPLLNFTFSFLFRPMSCTSTSRSEMCITVDQISASFSSCALVVSSGKDAPCPILLNDVTPASLSNLYLGLFWFGQMRLIARVSFFSVEQCMGGKPLVTQANKTR